MKIQVNTEALGAAWKTADAALEEFAQALAKTERDVSELNGTWKGGNHDQFVSRFEVRNKELGDAIAQLRAYASRMADARKLYEQWEAEVSSLASF